MARAKNSFFFSSRDLSHRNSIAHNSMLAKTRMPNINHIDTIEANDGQQQGQYTVDDVVKLVSFMLKAIAHKIIMVEAKTANETSNLSKACISFLRRFCTYYFFRTLEHIASDR